MAFGSRRPVKIASRWPRRTGGRAAQAKGPAGSLYLVDSARPEIASLLYCGLSISTAQTASDWRFRMLDLAMLILGLGFFALSVAYAYACERL
jgi:hypothetical protein